ncbi:MAG: peptidylprolyl isomerase [Thermomicrobiales bacterium]
MTDSTAIPTTSVRIETPQGEIVVALDHRAPGTVANFLRYVDAGLYDGGRFHRTVRPDNNSNAGLNINETDAGLDPNAPRTQLPNDAIVIEVIQGGINPDRVGEQGGPIALERTSETGLQHVDGTISMARLTPDSAVSDFFLCMGPQPELDFGGMRNPDGQGFAAFGQVTAGMDVVRAIQTSPSTGQSLTPPVTILSISRV